MSNITGYLNSIATAVKGKDVRQAIHDAIQQCYYDGKAGATDLQARQDVENLQSRANELENSIADLIADFNACCNFERVDSFTDGYNNISVGYKCGNLVIYEIEYMTTGSNVSDTNTDIGNVIHTIPQNVGTPITSARSSSPLRVEKKPDDTYVRNVYPEAVTRVNSGSRNILLATTGGKFKTTLCFLVET